MSLKRKRQPTLKGREYQESTAKPQELNVSCSIELTKTDGSVKEYTVKASNLEKETGDALTERDLFHGNRVLWKCRGSQYEVKICGTHRESTKKSPKRVILDDDDVELEDDSADAQKKRKIDSTLLSQTHDFHDADIACNNVVSTAIEVDNEGNQELHSDENDNANKLEISQSNLQDDLVFETPPRITTLKMESFTSPFQKNTKTTPSTPTGPYDNDRLSRIERKLDSLIKRLKKSRSTCIADEFVEEESKFITDTGVNLLQIRATNPSKYALQLMDIIFTDEEMSSSVYEASKRSTKPGLNITKVQYLE
uniref:Uncharacterized protein n=1 Tax=Amphimedon queenslandica TaxID=400682 RepID=A0A1X7TD73_AMPQE